VSGAGQATAGHANAAAPEVKAREPVPEAAEVADSGLAAFGLGPSIDPTLAALRPQAILSLQRRAGNGAVSQLLAPSRKSLSAITVAQRQAGHTSADAPASVPAPEPLASDASLVFEGKTISQVPEQMRAMLDKIAAQSGLKGAREFADRLNAVPGRPDLFAKWFSGRDSRAVNAAIDVVMKQMTQLEADARAFLEKFEPAAKDKTRALLKESKKRIEDEMQRYGISSKTVSAYTPLGQFLFGDKKIVQYSMEKNTASTLMAAAAGELVPMRQNLEGLIKKRRSLEQAVYGGDTAGPIGAPRFTVPEDKQAEWDELGKQIEEARRELNVAQTQREGLYPVLAAYKEEGEANTRALASVAKGADTAEGKNQVVATVTEKLQNIQKVEEGLGSGQVKVWKSKTIIEGTKAELQATPVERRVVDDRAAEIASDEFWSNLLIGAVAIALGLIAAIPTGGMSLAGAAAVTTAGAASAGLSVYQAAQTYREYMLAQAESGSDLDKAKAISAEDPSLIWLALDIVAAGLDIKGALNLFKALSVPVRRALLVRTATAEVTAVAKEGGEVAEEVVALKAALEATGNAKLTSKVMARVGTAVDASKPTIEALEKSAKAQYKALSDAGRLAEIGDVSEEVFVKQIVSGARGQVITAGEAGIRRTQLVTDLMQPGNPRIAAVLGGDAKAMDALLIEHGSWKGLMGMLEKGTPEMRQASQKLLGRRAQIYAEVEEKFGAKMAGTASTEAISDIDAATSGIDAGRKMIEAEEFVKAKFGPGWSEVLRMNFYTDAGRLTFYEKIMPGLSAAERAKLLGDVTAEAEKLNIAKMLHHAGEDPRRIAEVEAYAAKMGVNVKDARVQEMLGKMAVAGDKERNKLLLEIDDLVRRYNAAAPGSPEQIDLAKKITFKQMEANTLTVEAYIGPGAGRMTVAGIKVVGPEAYQAAMSNLEMIQHIMREAGGNAVVASREYEVYKYMNRFAEAAEAAGVKNPGLDYWKNFSGFVYGTERGATSSVAHLGERGAATASKKGTPVLSDLSPQIGEVTDQFLLNQYQSWQAFSQQVLGDLKKIAAEDPAAWARFNAPRPAAGAKP
jgi:hypothetical protein